MICKASVLSIIDTKIKDTEASIGVLTSMREDMGLAMQVQSLKELRAKIVAILDHDTPKGKDSSIDPDDRYYEEPGTWKSYGYVDANGWTHS